MKALFVALLGYVLVFATIRHIHPSGIMLYQGAALAAALACGFWLWRRQEPAAGKDALLVFLMSFVFAFTAPTTVDRAYSVRMLLRLDSNPQGLSRDEIGRMYVDGFLHEGGVEKRISEQKATGSVVEEDGRIRLTPVGRLLAGAFRLTQAAFASEDNR